MNTNAHGRAGNPLPCVSPFDSMIVYQLGSQSWGHKAHNQSKSTNDKGDTPTMANDTAAAPAAVPTTADIGLTSIRARMNAAAGRLTDVKGRVDAAHAANDAIEASLASEKRARSTAEAEARRLLAELNQAKSLLSSRDDTIADLQRKLASAGDGMVRIADVEAIIAQIEAPLAQLEGSSQKLSGGSRSS